MLTPSELEKIHADIVRLRAETMKRLEAPPTPVIDPTPSIRVLFWYPLAFVAGLFIAVAGVMVLIFHLLH